MSVGREESIQKKLIIRETHISKAEGALKYDGRTNPDISWDCWFNTSRLALIPLIGSRDMGFNAFYSGGFNVNLVLELTNAQGANKS